ncbi:MULTISPECIES: hemolysin family protein [unclassified Streptomyces]|uniref:hemolysin family protein n=1 Tax=unclassified Streptomyces TaxID=2593676 RepID=UPI0022B68D06|nr:MULTISPECIES: hemolysin family protein [unclassified Streptomyces]MCZ7412997.1 hemolysin family protein [Streptomyces sp. WMMC897]MCZ7434694.1 hemolysin family protein [Streptomyces sp. WMMC1477]
MTEVLLLGVALLLTLACGVFVAAEFSLTTVERGLLERAAAEREPGAAGALAAVRSLTFQLSGAQLGITLTSLLIGMLAEPSVATLLRGPVEAAGLPARAASSTALALGTAVSTVVLMVVGELVPKNWAISRPLAMARRVGPPQRAFSAAFRPFIRHLNNTANRTLHAMGLRPTEELASARSPQELVALARHSAEEGVLEADTAELFVRSLRLAELTAENVMTPRVRVHALEERATALDVATATRATGLSRFPVYRESLDTVVGVVHVKDVLAVPAAERPGRTVAGLAREPLLVPESLPADRVLDRLSERRSLAVVIDEYGGTAGVLTVEDILEEVVGEVRDEHDPQAAPELAPAGRDAAGRALYEAGGSTRADELEEIGLLLPEGPFETLAGLIATELGHIPSVGDAIEVAGWRVEVVDAAGRRADRVRLRAPSGALRRRPDLPGNGDGEAGG